MNLAKTVGEHVTENYRTAEVFEKFGIDFCCGGNIPLDTLCQKKGIRLSEIEGELDRVKREPVAREQNYGAWAPSFLADYIVNTHHSYLKENTAQIIAYTKKVASVHGSRHPEVVTIAETFKEIAEDLEGHLAEEETVCFPAIRRLEAAASSGRPLDPKDMAILQAALKTLGTDHEKIGDAAHKIRHLSKDYAIPEDACNTFAVSYQKLKEFEDDLHKHVHLENNILFPKAARMCR